MARAKLSADRKTGSDRIRKAAINLFKTLGYHGTSVRALAQAVRLEPAALYYYFPSKQAILFDLFDRTMDALLQGLDDAVAGAATAEDQLQAVVRFHVLFHIARQDEAFISHSELRSLTARNRERIIAKRDRYETTLRALLTAGVRDGVFHIPDVKMTSTAVLVMCSGVSDWFTPEGRFTPGVVADGYAEMVFRLVGRSPEPRTRELNDPRRSRISAKTAPRGRSRLLPADFSHSGLSEAVYRQDRPTYFR